MRKCHDVALDYSGWLGDFGPLHTKTVRNEWESEDNDEEEDAFRRNGM
jgi:hypothetical protein